MREGEGGGLADAGHQEGNVTLYINREFLHGGNELGSAVDVYGAVDLEVEKVVACECREFVSNRSFVTKSAFISGGVCVASQFYV